MTDTPGGTPYTGPDPNEPIQPGQYPEQEGSGPGAPDYGYPFPVEGPTAPGTGDPGSTTTPGAPVEYAPPETRYYDPTYNSYGPRRRPHHPRMPQDPFNTHKLEQETEFGWGEGMYPDPILDYSGGGSRSRFPLADPDARDQHRNLAAIRRTDVSNPFAPMDPYVPGNPDRFGASPPLVRKRGKYRRSSYKPPRPPRMEREW